MRSLQVRGSYLALFLVVALLGCEAELGSDGAEGNAQGATAAQVETSWDSLVASHTSGVISRTADIRIRFVNEQVSDEEAGREAPALLRFEPGILGVATWETTRELRFLPAASLPSGTRFRASLTLPGDALPDKPFTFDFSVIRQDFEVRIEGLASDPDVQKHRVLNGSVTTADAAPGTDLEKLLIAEYEGEEKKIVWEHAADNRLHRFAIKGIERGNDPRTLSLRWDGGSIGVQSQGQREVEVPPLGVFKVEHARAHGTEGDQIFIHFSDNLDRRQDLAGMVRVAGKDVRAAAEGNRIRAYPEGDLVGEVEVQVSAGVRNADGAALEKPVSLKVQIEAKKPGVRFAGRGVILPDNDQLTIPFEAVSASAVQVTAFQVYDDNVGRFLQDNQLDGQSQLHRVGRHLWRKTIELNGARGGGWRRYALDVSELLTANRGRLMRLTLSINRGNSLHECPASDVPPAIEQPYSDHDDLNAIDRSNWDGWEQPTTNWKDRDDPCKDAYYRMAGAASDSRNFLASNLGLLAKRGDETALHVISTDLASAEPSSGVAIQVFNFQNQEIGSGRTDDSGTAMIEVDATPFYLAASKGEQRGYLKLSHGTALATSHFDVGGEQVRKGVKAHLYGERGVWRPSDLIHLTFVVHDPQGSLPDQHPVTLTLTDPRGQRVLQRTNDAPIGGFYRFELETAEDAPTGRWTAVARLGGLTFTKALRIETVIPNRLKAELDFGVDVLHKDEMPLDAKIFSQWLHGADASGLKADVQYQLRGAPTQFSRAADFVFDDPTRKVESELTSLFKGTLDASGRAAFPLELPVAKKSPGQLVAQFTTRVFEESGAFSTERISVPFHPYDRYVGVRTPPGDRARSMLLTDEDHALEIATVNSHGEPVSVPNVDLRLYKLDWRWWWNKSGESLAQYATATHRGLIAEGSVSTESGVGSWNFRIEHPEWGRYLLRACDRSGGHCSGKIVYIDWPGWAGRAQEQGGIGATALSLTGDKERYVVGETARITLPVAQQGRILLSVETGSKVLSQRWVEATEGENQVEIPLTAEMAPTAYASVVLLQPHAGKQNDRPIRLYGYLPLHVENPETHLDVQLVAPEEIRPRKTTQIEVAEGAGRAMAYTIAIVDEGLLGLTRYRTPNLHDAFFAREALGIRTWDLFDLVVGAYGGELERLLALGGGASLEPVEQQKKKRRFPPVVKFLGPFELEAGDRATHEFELPEYIGAVRVMVVAGNEGAFGSVEKSIFVRDRVMLHATLPRVLGPGERVALPVAVFATDPQVKQVDVEVEVDERFEVEGADSASLQFDKPGDQITTFDLDVASTLGQGVVKVRASGAGAAASSEIAIEIRSPNRETLRQTHAVIESGANWSGRVVPHGLPGTNEVALELSSIPPLNLERRLEFLIRYPYGCVEQTTSAVFPQLFLPQLASLDPDQKQEVETNVAEGIGKIRNFQRHDGSFGYWPGAGTGHDWSTSYAGHFLVEASKQGYHVPVGMLPDWVAYQRGMATSWIAGGSSSSFEQAYRLYVLALAGEPEIGAMNRLRESGQKESRTRWLLAAAYRAAGVEDAADALVESDDFVQTDYTRKNRTFGSSIRDESIFLMSSVALGRLADSERWVQAITKSLASDRWYSTQSTAWALLALSRYVGGSESVEAFAATYRRGGADERSVNSNAPILRVPLDRFPPGGEMLEVTNTSERRLYAAVSTRGIPEVGQEVASASGLRIEVRYTDVSGEALDISRLSQGRDLIAHVEVVNTQDRPHENLALSHLVPSGWEIHDPRFEGTSAQPSAIDYQDVRDDRVYTYFGLEGGKRKSFRLLLNAAYRGRYYLPPVSVEAMYDASVNARSVGRWIEIVDDAGL